MNDDLLNILSNSNKDIDNQMLMDYLSGKLSPEKSHEVEKMMADNDLFNDALEGLQQIRDKKDIQTYVEQLNRDLQKNLRKKRQRREKRKLKEGIWGYTAVIVIIMLCIAGYYVVKKILAAHGYPSAK
jgi:anti-sigma factor RsiW